MILLGGGVFAQTKAEKKAKKEAKAQKGKDDTAVLISMVEAKKFVLEANTLYSRAGMFVFHPEKYEKLMN